MVGDSNQPTIKRNGPEAEDWGCHYDGGHETESFFAGRPDGGRFVCGFKPR